MSYPVMPLGFLGSQGDQGDNDSYKIERSLRFNSADSAYLNRTPASAGNRKTWTWSGWVKLGSLGTTRFIFGANSGSTAIRTGTSSDTIGIDWNGGTSLRSTQVLRDVSSWGHLVVSVDTTQVTASNRIRVYWNGSEITSWATDNRTTTPSQNSDGDVNNSSSHIIGSTGAGSYYDGYLAEIYLIDGQALTPSSFGETDAITGRWKAKAYSGTYGTNGFYLKFADNSGTTSTTLGKDSSPNGNNWTPNNFSVTAGAGNDSLVDSPTNYGTDTGVGGEVRGNYCTLDALSKDLRKIAQATFSASLTNGNLDWKNTATSVSGGCPSTMVANYKCYFEANINTVGAENTIGISDISTDWKSIGGIPSAGLYCWVTGGGSYGNGTTNLSSKPTATTNDVLMVAYNPENGKIWFGKNGTWNGSGDPSSGTNEAFTISDYLTQKVPFVLGYQSASFSLNFGQRPFAYTAPSGFKALCTTNLPTPTIQKPSSYMDVVTYTGNGSTQTISSLGFSPDLLWVKGRSQTSANHILTDSVRGNGKSLMSNNTNAEGTRGATLTSNGFSFTYPDEGGDANFSAATYVAWAWDEAPIAGMDIVSYTGNGTNRTIAHNLGVAPKMIICKNKSQAIAGGDDTHWCVYHSSVGSGSVIFLNLTNAAVANTAFWNSTNPTSSVFSIGTSNRHNYNGDGHIAYLFAEVEGFSKFGSYTGNGSADGPFVWCGFRPRWVMIKRSDGGAVNWWIFDAVTDSFNVISKGLSANTADAESSGNTWADMTSNGIKIRTTSAGANASGGTYIFAAFAESAYKYARAR